MNETPVYDATLAEHLDQADEDYLRTLADLDEETDPDRSQE